MTVEFSRDELLKCLQATIGVVERRQTMPVLANVLIEIDGDRFRIIGTDLEIELVAEGSCKSAGKMSWTASGRKFLDIVRSLPEQAQIQCTVVEDRMTLRAGGSRFALATLPISDFPRTSLAEDSVRVSIHQEHLKLLLERTQFSMAHQDVRYYLNGLLFDLQPGLLRAVATDGHRLSMAEVNLEETALTPRQIILPRKGILELQKLLDKGPMTIHLSSNQVVVMLDGIRFTSKLVDGRFPDYEKVIPKHLPRSLTVDRQALRVALSRAAILSNEKFRGVRLGLDPRGLTIRAHNAEQEEAEEFLAGDYNGEAMEIGFNVAYLLEPLAVLPNEQVRLEFSDANGSCLLTAIEDDNPAVPSRHVVMPMRL